ncbi:MAG: hypothetical protein LBP99_06505 [Azoarcus sp.]|jgi:hypothetical protein|nr:hypothetical protein [Azoarcus sp.]
MRYFAFLLLCVMTLALHPASSAQTAELNEYVIMLSAQISESPAKIRLQWPGYTVPMGSYEVYRKNKNATSWEKVATLSGSATSYEDTNVVVGKTYEYRFMTKPGAAPGFDMVLDFSKTRQGYIFAGIKVPPVESRGKVVLLVESEQAKALRTELKTLKTDLIGDGWTVLRHDVPRNATPQSTRALIQADYNADPANVKAVFLLGHIPVFNPVFKSGNLAPDGHTNHMGPWPADAYYGSMDTSWDDNIPENPGYAQSKIPGNVQLQVGRVDFDNMPAFQKNATELLRQYLNKNHKYRIGQMTATKNAFISDGFGRGKLDNAASYNGYKLFSTLWGPNARIDDGPWTQYLPQDTYTWGHINGGGSYTSCAAVGGTLTTGHLATQNYGVIFWQSFGSYFGNWNTQNNLMRALLAMPDYGLTSAWTGRPHWFFHHMALGETIGYSTWLTQNNKGILYAPSGGIGANDVHIALMGDPTLRMFPVLPATNLQAKSVSGTTELQWTASEDSEVTDYYVYGASNPGGPYKRLEIVKGTNWINVNPGNTKYYMVRASKLIPTGSGSFYNLSQGTMAEQHRRLTQSD